MNHLLLTIIGLAFVGLSLYILIHAVLVAGFGVVIVNGWAIVWGYVGAILSLTAANIINASINRK